MLKALHNVMLLQSVKLTIMQFVEHTERSGLSVLDNL